MGNSDSTLALVEGVQGVAINNLKVTEDASLTVVGYDAPLEEDVKEDKKKKKKRPQR